MKSPLILAAGLAFAFGGAAFAQDVPPSTPPVEEPAPMDDPAAPVDAESGDGQPETAPPETAQPESAPSEAAPPEADQPGAAATHSTTGNQAPPTNSPKQRGRVGEPRVIDHSYDTAPVPNPTISSITIIPPPA